MRVGFVFGRNLAEPLLVQLRQSLDDLGLLLGVIGSLGLLIVEVRQVDLVELFAAQAEDSVVDRL